MVKSGKTAAWGMVVAAGMALLPDLQGRARGVEEGQWTCPPPPVAGFPRPWQTGLRVSTYSTANAQDRNLITVVPIISWSGVGPDVNMMLYHNSASTNSTLDLTRGMGFRLGPGWTTSYSAQLVFEQGGLRVIWDDQSQDVYTYDNGEYLPPPGVFDRLEYHSGSGTYRITHKDQSQHVFVGASGPDQGVLTEVVDAVGNRLRIERDTENDTFKVIDAAGRELHLQYDSGSGKLLTIWDPGYSGGTSSVNVAARQWDLMYHGKNPECVEDKNKLRFLKFPLRDGLSENDRIEFHWVDGGRIYKMSDRYNPQAGGGETAHVYEFEYEANGMVKKVTDPTDPGEGLTQEFATTCFTGGSTVETEYLDRRGSIWTYRSYRPQPVADRFWFQLAAIKNPLGQETTYTYDSNNLLVEYRDALNRGWHYWYTIHGNRWQATDVENTERTHQWTYDSYHNVTSYSDPLGHTTTYTYHYMGGIGGLSDAADEDRGAAAGCAGSAGDDGDGILPSDIASAGV